METTKTYRVRYNGNATQFKLLNEKVTAKNKREAVEKVYKLYNDEHYFPSEDGTIRDAVGDTIATFGDEVIDFDCGVFYAEEVMNITRTERTTIEWRNEDTGERIQHDTDTDTFYYWNKDGDIRSSWEINENARMIELCSTSVEQIWIGSTDRIDNTKFVLNVLTSLK